MPIADTTLRVSGAEPDAGRLRRTDVVEAGQHDHERRRERSIEPPRARMAGAPTTRRSRPSRRAGGDPVGDHGARCSQSLGGMIGPPELGAADDDTQIRIALLERRAIAAASRRPHGRGRTTPPVALDQRRRGRQRRQPRLPEGTRSGPWLDGCGLARSRPRARWRRRAAHAVLVRAGLPRGSISPARAYPRRARRQRRSREPWSSDTPSGGRTASVPRGIGSPASIQGGGAGDW